VGILSARGFDETGRWRVAWPKQHHCSASAVGRGCWIMAVSGPAGTGMGAAFEQAQGCAICEAGAFRRPVKGHLAKG